jgi:hypothetical protein
MLYKFTLRNFLLHEILFINYIELQKLCQPIELHLLHCYIALNIVVVQKDC